MPEIILEHITHCYGDKEVLNDFTYSFEQGKTTCLIGPSGCGKTTVLASAAPDHPMYWRLKGILIPSENIAVATAATYERQA